MANKTRSKHQEGLYKAYQAQNRQASNRKKKLQRALKRNPENLQIVEALKNIKYRRGTPKTSVWSASSKRFAQLKSLYAKKCDNTYAKVSVKDMFKLSTRAHCERGNLIWNS